jgi:hypothetical protein
LIDKIEGQELGTLMAKYKESLGYTADVWSDAGFSTTRESIAGVTG